MNINMEQLGTLVTGAGSVALDELTKLLQNAETSIDEKLKIAEQIRKINDDIARWDVLSGAISGEQDDRKKLINKLDDLK